MRRPAALLVALALLLLGASALPAYAEDPPPVRSSPGDPFGGETLPPGPIYIITPGTEPTGLPPTSAPEDLQEQIEKDREQAEAEAEATPSGTATGTPGAGATDGAGAPLEDPTAGPGGTAEEDAAEAAEDEDSNAAWVLAGVAVLAVAALVAVLLLARRRRDQDQPGSLDEHAS